MGTLDREVGEHDVRLSNIEKTLGSMQPQVESIAIWVAKQEAVEGVLKEKRDYWGLVTSGAIAAVVGAIAAWFTSGGTNASP